MQAYLITLTPEDNIKKEIVKAKSEIFKRFGNQKFLLDPPHTTLYLALAEDLNEVEKRLEKIASEQNIINIEVMNTWQEFPKDELAGVGTSLALKLKEGNKTPIVNLQKRIIYSLNDLRKSEIHLRYKNTNLPKELKENLEKYGFPFVGEVLIPHIGFCCFNPPKNAEEFKKTYSIDNFVGPTSFTKLSLYKLHNDDRIELIRDFGL